MTQKAYDPNHFQQSNPSSNQSIGDINQGGKKTEQKHLED